MTYQKLVIKMWLLKGSVFPCLILISVLQSQVFCKKLLASQATLSGPLVQSFLREPFDQIAAVGEHVTLPCRVINKRGVLQWTRDDFGLGSERQLIGFDRYQMTGSDEEGKKLCIFLCSN